MNTRKFYVGQKVVIVKANQAPHLLGEVGVIVEGLHEYRAIGIGVIQTGYTVEIASRRYGAIPEALRPYYDPPELGSWNELAHIWQPEGLRC